MPDQPKERPILFNAEMVRAIIDGRKTQTRRVVKLDIDGYPNRPGDKLDMSYAPDCPYGVPGDRLWVREACQAGESEQGHPGVYYPTTSDWRWGADDAEWDKLWKYAGDRGRTVPSIHMPRWASRILLEVTDVRVERVAEISEDDAVAEGCTPATCPDPRSPSGYSLNLNARVGGPRREFKTLWESIAKPGQQWADNPWVWAVTFKVLKGGAPHA